MMHCVSVETMRMSDLRTIEKGTPSRLLISRAARAVYGAVNWRGRIAIFTGSGNNGADGFALSVILKKNGYDVCVIHVSERMHDDCAFYALEARKNGVPILSYFDLENRYGYDIIVDCLLGTGFQGLVNQNYRKAIDFINQSSSYVVSVDINSGMNGDTGEGDSVVCSDLTIAIEFIKKGQITERAGLKMKRLICVSVGIEPIKVEVMLCSNNEWRRFAVDAHQSECRIDEMISVKVCTVPVPSKKERTKTSLQPTEFARINDI